MLSSPVKTVPWRYSWPQVTGGVPFRVCCIRLPSWGKLLSIVICEFYQHFWSFLCHKKNPCFFHYTLFEFIRMWHFGTALYIHSTTLWWCNSICFQYWLCVNCHWYLADFQMLHKKIYIFFFLVFPKWCWVLVFSVTLDLVVLFSQHFYRYNQCNSLISLPDMTE